MIFVVRVFVIMFTCQETWSRWRNISHISYLFVYLLLLHIVKIKLKKSEMINMSKTDKNLSRSVYIFRAMYSLVALKEKCTLVLVFQLTHHLQDKFLGNRTIVNPRRSRATLRVFSECLGISLALILKTVTYPKAV